MFLWLLLVIRAADDGNFFCALLVKICWKLFTITLFLNERFEKS